MISREQIIDVLTGRSSHEEAERLYRRIAENEADAHLYAEVKNEYVFGHLPYLPGSSARLHRKNGRRVWELLIRVAAVLFIPLCCYFLYELLAVSDRTPAQSEPMTAQKPAMMRQYVHNGVKGQVDLPDGTQVWLNSGSTLSYPAQFKGNMRAVALTGEAYFNVKHNPELPFCIQMANGMVVRVTGTEFNLSCYEGDPSYRLNLVKGSVELLKDNRVVARLHERDQVTIASDGCRKSSETAENTAKTAAWRDGYLLFDNEPMSEVIRRLERWYGIRITVDNPLILNYKFTATFHSESLTQVLDMLQVTSNIRSEVKDQSVKLM